jgi:sialate O-acetylesterase
MFTRANCETDPQPPPQYKKFEALAQKGRVGSDEGDRTLKKTRHILAVGCALLFAGIACQGEIRLPHLLSDHAVLQRNAPIHLWGWATPHAQLTFRMHDQVHKTDADDLGRWSVWLMPEHAGGPYMLSIDGDGHIELHDLLIGDVWLASGQSNMEFPLKGFPTYPMKDSAKEIANANDPQLRLMLVGREGSDYPLNDVTGKWTDCTPQTAADFSAVAYFFGREIAEKEHVAVGLIDATWGGTPADSWMSMDTLGSNPALFPVFYSRSLFANDEIDRQMRLKMVQEATRASGSPPPQVWHPSQISWMPAGLYNGMIAPVTPYSIKGWIWYQGETNSRKDRAPYYSTLFPALIADWRIHFAQGDLPFLFVQISSFISPKEDWGMIRDAQRRTLALRNTAMAVTIDVGDPHSVHPPDKQIVGARLALAARGMVYDEHIEYQSPLFRQVTSEPGALRVWFSDAEGLSSHGKPVESFEIAGADHQFIPAVAHIDGETVVVSSPSVPSPQFVRYAWDSAAQGSLYNSAGLPASTFTSEVVPTP